MDIPVGVYAFWQSCFELFGRKMLQIVLIMGAFWVVNVLINGSVHLPLSQLSPVRTPKYCPRWPFYSRGIMKASVNVIGMVDGEERPRLW